MNLTTPASGLSWQSRVLVVLASVALHGLLLGSAWWFMRELPRPRRVVTVQAICLSEKGIGGGSPGGSPAAVRPVAPRPAPPPPKPAPVKEVKAKPRQKVATAPRPVTPEPPLSLALPRPAPPTTGQIAKGSATPAPQGGGGGGSGSGRGTGSGSGSGTGSGTGSGSGAGPGVGNALQNYLAKVRRLLEQHKTYPPLARRRHEEGVVVVRFTIGAGGHIDVGGVARSSGHHLLDQAAQDTVKRVHRFPPLPPELGRDRLSIEVPLAFRLQEG